MVEICGGKWLITVDILFGVLVPLSTITEIVVMIITASYKVWLSIVKINQIQTISVIRMVFTRNIFKESAFD